MTNVIVTGLPRSGLTSVAALIDFFPNSVCLNRPAHHMVQAHSTETPEEYVQWLIKDFQTLRQQFLQEVPVRDLRFPDGVPYLDGIYDSMQSLDENGRPKPVYFTKSGLHNDCILAAKHHTLYTAFLPEIVKSNAFTVIAVIRHPVDVVLSWRRMTGTHPFIQGKIPKVLYPFWPEAARISEAKLDITDRMVQLYDAYCQRYHDAGKHIHLISFEEVLKNPGWLSQILKREEISPGIALLAQPAHIRSLEGTQEIGRKLQQYGVYSKYYYKS